ncbi:MAG: hypothetical protein QF535_06085, partial [Anaerolineales bacterium]|nr:hypothetical protein [Anaerolineales bacterium]
RIINALPVTQDGILMILHVLCVWKGVRNVRILQAVMFVLRDITKTVTTVFYVMKNAQHAQLLVIPPAKNAYPLIS